MVSIDIEAITCSDCEKNRDLKGVYVGTTQITVYCPVCNRILCFVKLSSSED